MLIAQSLIDDTMDEMHDLVNTALAGTGVIQFFDGTMPTTPEDPDTGSMLVACDMNATPFGALTGDTFSANAISPGVAINSGTPTYVRAKASGAGACILQWEIGADFTVTGGPIVSGNTMTIDDITITLAVEGG